MNRRRALWLLTGLPATALAQLENFDVGGALEQGRRLLQESGQEDLLRALDDVDEAKVRRILNELVRRLKQDYVLDLAELLQNARLALRLLEDQNETKPFADWLRARLDYFEVADQFRRATPPPKPPAPGQPPPHAPNPSPPQQRVAWQKTVEKEPQPKGASRYVPVLKPVFTRQRVPPELVWVAEVESSFNPEARSPVGAAGLFQLMPKTAQWLGLSLSPRDERLVPEKNAAAAGRYLAYLYGKFRNWPLVLAAYNAGEGTVRARLDRSKGKTFDDIATRLPAETQMYVPRIDATLQRREKVSLARLPAPKA